MFPSQENYFAPPLPIIKPMVLSTQNIIVSNHISSPALPERYSLGT